MFEKTRPQRLRGTADSSRNSLIVISLSLVLIFLEHGCRDAAMYREYFGLQEAPFSIAPNPRYLYMSGGHQEALAHLLYGIRSDGGLVLLTGDVGTGKTTLCRFLLEQIPGDTDVAFLLNPKLTVTELLAAVCDELGIAYPERETSVKVFVDLVNNALLDAHARGRRTVLIIEEAQNLGIDVLEQLRLLTNLETDEQKLLKIVLIGQPELRDLLARGDLRQLSQRITARYHLAPLAQKEVGAYVAHRLTVAGGRRTLFPPSAIAAVARLSGGIPRLINLLCDRALLGAYAQGKDSVDRSILNHAAAEVFGESGDPLRRRRRLLWCAIPSLIITFIVVGLLFHRHTALLHERGDRASSLHEAWNGSLPGIDTVWWFGGQPLRERLPDIVRGQGTPGEFPAVLSGDSPVRRESRGVGVPAALAHDGPPEREGQGILGAGEDSAESRGEGREAH